MKKNKVEFVSAEFSALLLQCCLMLVSANVT